MGTNLFDRSMTILMWSAAILFVVFAISVLIVPLLGLDLIFIAAPILGFGAAVSAYIILLLAAELGVL